MLDEVEELDLVLAHCVVTWCPFFRRFLPYFAVGGPTILARLADYKVNERYFTFARSIYIRRPPFPPHSLIVDVQREHDSICKAKS